MNESYKLNPSSKSMDENSYEDLVLILSSFPKDVIDEICSKAKVLREHFVQNFSQNDADLQSSSGNSIPFPSSKSFDNLNETSNTVDDGVETAEIILEDTSEVQGLYLKNQQDAFDEFVKPNFPIKKLPRNAFCREWLLKHAECCLKSSMLEHSDNHKEFQISNQNDVPLPTIESDHNSHETKNIDEEDCNTEEKIQADVPTMKHSAQNFLNKNMDLRSSTENDMPLLSSESFDNSHVIHMKPAVSLDEFVRPKRRSPTKACRKWLSKHFFCCLRGSVLEHSDDNRDEKDIRRIFELAEQRIFDDSHESRNMGSDDDGSPIQKVT
ncbi:hypothetical protein AVEN_133846-1 [Araneus ventricosus]|uniref:Uncharacterized protein n=1 Tax=Araneus ventricosus TaxID=182803 RepID=A0A4Y2L941_ARAVE|nr:hypothetical protein AVEN_133846-1 [Araneus ventricosus]